jgi:hypothetical protein
MRGQAIGMASPHLYRTLPTAAAGTGIVIAAACRYEGESAVAEDAVSRSPLAEAFE